MKKIGIIGAGTMGSGIAQLIALKGYDVILYDTNVSNLNKAKNNILFFLKKTSKSANVDAFIAETMVEEVFNRIIFSEDLNEFKSCVLVIEAVVEDLKIKQDLFSKLEDIVNEECILATNTSSLSITSIASVCKFPNRVVGMHFFNPVIKMELVEIIPALQTELSLESLKKMVKSWDKIPVIAKDTPGFIVNRIVRPYYGEALRILDEGIASKQLIDWAMENIGGFKMGPFKLMDHIGNDVNYTVSETIFKSFYNDPKYTPSITQKRLVEAGWLGKKSGKGFYNYNDNGNPCFVVDYKVALEVFVRIFAMLVNEAYDALHYRVASEEDIDLSVKKGVNYPKGLIEWSKQYGVNYITQELDRLHFKYHEDRYRTSVLLSQKSRKLKYNEYRYKEHNDWEKSITSGEYFKELECL